MSIKKKLLIIVPLAVILLLTAVCVVYVSDYYHADLAAIESFNAALVEEYEADGDLVFLPQDATTGLIFYPGGKVEHTAYIPLMRAFASQGIACVLVKMPLRLAVLDMDAAKDIPAQFPQIEHWYLGGHSLGGSMAASCLSKHPQPFEGLILLGSYSTADLSSYDGAVLSIYGSEDRVLNQTAYEENQCNLPDGFTETVIPGGCHAYFGMYGKQEGDGTPTITNQEQILLTANIIVEFLAS